MIGKWLKVLGQALPQGEILCGMKNNILQHDRFPSVKIKDIRVLLLGSVGLLFVLPCQYIKRHKEFQT